MTDYMDRCLGEGLPSISEYFDLIDAGDDDFASDPEVCVHEAGHAVAAYVVGRPIESISADEWDEDSSWETSDGGTVYIGFPGGKVCYGEVINRPLNQAETAQRMYREIITAMAGGYAKSRYAGGNPERAMSPSDCDGVLNAYYSFCELIGEVVRPPFELPVSHRLTDWHRRHFEEWVQNERPPTSTRDLWAEVVGIVDANWDLMEGLATVLTYRPYLDGPEVYEVFERIEARRAASN